MRSSSFQLALPALAVEYTDCTSTVGVRPPNEYPDMTLKNLMMPGL